MLGKQANAHRVPPHDGSTPRGVEKEKPLLHHHHDSSKLGQDGFIDDLSDLPLLT